MPWWSELMEKYKISIKWPGAILHSITLELQSFSSTENLASFHTINRRTHFISCQLSVVRESEIRELGNQGIRD